MKIKLIKGDITEINVDAIVNAANTSLLGGGGVDGAIHRKGGPEILAGCMEIRQRQGGCDVGEAVITEAGNLPSKRVIHTVPVYNDGGGDKVMLLKRCYQNSIQLLMDKGLSSIAFPNISTGIYKFPKQLAAETAIAAVREFEKREELDLVLFVCFDQENYQIYNQLLNNETRIKKI